MPSSTVFVLEAVFLRFRETIRPTKKVKSWRRRLCLARGPGPTLRLLFINLASQIIGESCKGQCLKMLSLIPYEREREISISEGHVEDTLSLSLSLSQT